MAKPKPESKVPVKEALWEDDGLLAVHKPWGMRAYVARKEGEQSLGQGSCNSLALSLGFRV